MDPDTNAATPDDRDYPEEPAGPFPEPPLSFVDDEGREIDVRILQAGHVDSLTEMYVDFAPSDRAQGLPPSREGRIRSWLDVILDEGPDVVALHGDRVVGHATLVPDETGAAELAIFVHQDYQRAGIGSKLIRALLGYAAATGIERVWLTVERWNRGAVHLYETVGFETTNVESFELEMALRLDGD